MAWSSRRGRRSGVMAQSVTRAAPAHEASSRWARGPRLHRPAHLGIARRIATRQVGVGLLALPLALALCALVARDGGLFWPWPILAPASLAGLGGLALAHRALAGSLSRTFVAGVVAVTGVPALLAALGAFVALPAIATAVVAAAPGLLALAVLALPLVAHAGTSSEARRRGLRVAFLASMVGLMPLCLWPGL